MPRKTRMYLPGVPVHVIQRGNNRMPCFFADRDYQLYKEFLSVGLGRYGGRLHAYCLMTNHAHLLITPDEEDSISRVMQHLGRQYVQYVNRHYQRTGTLWEGRHKSSLIDTERYLLTCYRYIELNPVKAGMVVRPEHYPWSSARYHAVGIVDDLVTPHPCYQSLGAREEDRLAAYSGLLMSTLTDDESERIHTSIAQNLPTGDERFTLDIESRLGRKLRPGRPGRPERERRETSGVS